MQLLIMVMTTRAASTTATVTSVIKHDDPLDVHVLVSMTSKVTYVLSERQLHTK